MREAWSHEQPRKVFLAGKTARSQAPSSRLPAPEGTAVRPVTGDSEGRRSERRVQLDPGHSAPSYLPEAGTSLLLTSAC